MSGTDCFKIPVKWSWPTCHGILVGISALLLYYILAEIKYQTIGLDVWLWSFFVWNLFKFQFVSSYVEFSMA